MNQKENMKINHISVSRESLWQECKKKYHFKYHLQIEAPTEPIYFLYGKIVHKIIEVYTKSQGKENINKITESVLNGEILLEESFGNKPEKKVTTPLPIDYRNKLPEHLTSFMKLTKVLGFEGDVELKFEHDLDPPHHRILTGLIDRMVRKPRSCLIVDYKTTKVGPYRKTRKTIGGDLQLQCYAKVAQKMYGYAANQITCALYFLEGAEFLPVQFSQETIDNVEKRLLNVYKDIQSTDPNTVQGNVGKHCYRCEYSNMCPFFNRI